MVCSSIAKESIKPEVRYYIKPAFRNEGARIQNISVIKDFNSQQIRES